MPHTPDPDTLKVKGTIIKAALAFVEGQSGSDPIQRLAKQLDDENRKLVTGMVLPGSFYPLRRFVEIIETIDRVFGRGDMKYCRELGRFSADFQVNMIHKVFLKIGRLDYWMRLAGTTWKSYYGAGTMTAGFDAKAGWVHLAEFHPISKAFCYRFEGWGQRICELSGRRHVQPRHTSCILDGDEKCVWDVTWRD